MHVRFNPALLAKSASRTFARLGAMAAGLFVLASTGFAQSSPTDTEMFLRSAQQLEAAGDYQGAVAAYRKYFATGPAKSAQRRHARIKLPVLQEAVSHGFDQDLYLYLSALDSRADGNISAAVDLLDQIETQYPSGLLIDDATYLRAYIAMMDSYNFQLAYDTLHTLRSFYPDSRYYDTALYSQAIAQEQLGNIQSALEYLLELQARHTGITLAALSWPRDEYLSRLWYERATQRIDYLQNHQHSAANLISMESIDQHGFRWRATISHDGHDIVLLLNKSPVLESTTLLNANGDRLQMMDTHAFAGKVEGEPDSWARVTLKDNNLRGTLSVYGQRIELSPQRSGGTLSDFYPLLLGDIDGVQAPEPDHVLHPPKNETPFDYYMRSIKAETATAFSDNTVTSAIPIGVLIDSKFNDYHGGRGIQQALSILNTTDGIFREEFGLAIMIDTIVLIDDRDNDPMNLGSVTMEAMMRNFRDYRLDSVELGSDIGLATLFSGNKNNDAALGLAWIGAACRTDGYDVSVVTPYRLAELLSTHEIAHTLGAPHDSDTACSNQTTRIMWPYLSDKTRNKFSSCSRDSVRQVLERGSCLLDALDLSVDLIVGEDSVDITISNNDNLRITSGATATITGKFIAEADYPPNCTAIQNGISCSIGELAPNSVSQFSVATSTPLSDSDTIVASVTPVGFLDIEGSNNAVSNDINGNRRALPPPVTTTSSSGYTDPPEIEGDPRQAASGSFLLLDIFLLIMIAHATRRSRAPL
ncbi:hypothetical protein AB833_19540 [Chromatiales bacterium (ex Bugula neritina AB1)]|nr:hypothetical protein AB833_19540 [Chromatiales bacterium (ex Bugula neritina AB1)]